MQKSQRYDIIKTTYQGSFPLKQGGYMIKRRDNKNRILQTGESQRKDGRYLYKYTDSNGKINFIYSWKLVETDKMPKGKKQDKSLREKIRQIQKDIQDGIDTQKSKITLIKLYEKYTNQRANIKPNTQKGRKLLKDILKKSPIGNYPIDKIKPSHAKEWIKQMKQQGYAYNTINNYKCSLKAAFQVAIQDDYIRKNPFDIKVSTIIQDDTKEKQPLNKEQEKSLLEFIKQDKTYSKYYNDIIILIGTGLRISELCGLTTKDIDLTNKTITIDHQLLKDKQTYYIQEPKTKNAIRQIPMNKQVYQAIQEKIKQREENQTKQNQFTVDGYTSFLFQNQKGKPNTLETYDQIFKRIREKYNKQEQAYPLPKILTPHTLRHTYCTNLAKAGINPKTLQYLMGHANINITLNYYTHTNYESVKEELQRLIE